MSAYRPTTGATLAHDLERFADFVATRMDPTDDETRNELAAWLNKKLDSLLASDAFGTEGQQDPRGDHR